MSEPTRILLEEHEIPTHWYNIAADLSTPPAPPLGPDGKPIDPSAMAAIFPEPILEQEMSRERWIAIPPGNLLAFKDGAPVAVGETQTVAQDFPRAASGA